jgi:hypothetical protein
MEKMPAVKSHKLITSSEEQQMPHRHSATLTINPVSVVREDFVVMAGMPDVMVDSFRWTYFEMNLAREVLADRRPWDVWVAFWPVVWRREP